MTGDAKNVLRAGYGRSFFPVPYAAGNLLDQNVPDSISQNYSVETNPLDFSPSRVPRLSNPFPAIVPLKPQGTAELNQANPLDEGGHDHRGLLHVVGLDPVVDVLVRVVGPASRSRSRPG